MKHLRYLISFLLLVTASACAETLSFKSGDKASYRIQQGTSSEIKIFDTLLRSESDAIITLDVKVLNVDEDTFNYPFDVEVTLKSISFSEIQKDGRSITTIKYDSQNSKKSSDDYVLAEYINKLIDHPLYFKVSGDFDVEETSGYLDDLFEVYEIPSDMGILGTTPWSFKLLLTQLFHLSGQNLLLEESYPVNCYQLLNWEDDPFEESELNIQESSEYSVKSADAKEIQAVWKGCAKVTSQEYGLNGNVSVSGNVTWDTTNPMIQQRKLKVAMEEGHSDYSHVKATATQVWESK